MEAGVRLSAALPPESKEIRPLFENTGGSARPAFQYPQPESLPRLDFAGIGNACLMVGKEVRDGSRRFGNWWPVAPGVLCLACQSKSRDEEEEHPNAVRYEVGGS
jgi:hypothetical protein